MTTKQYSVRKTIYETYTVEAKTAKEAMEKDLGVPISVEVKKIRVIDMKRKNPAE